jgi:T5SS/PEP-CTERM-associated repeat protein
MASGAGSILDNKGFITVGDAATGSNGQPGGSLSVTNGASATTAGLTIASQADSTGSVLVDGANSILTDTQHLTVGKNGTGKLSVTNGGALFAFGSGISIGAGGIEISTMSVGSGSGVLNTGGLVVGDGGKGILSITEGSTFTTGSIEIGLQAAAQGKVTVDGSSSKLKSDGFTTVGDGATGALFLPGGTLSVTNGANFMTAGLTIGSQAGSRGYVSVDGSTLTDSQHLAVGKNGTDTLSVSNGGKISVGGSTDIGSGAAIYVSGSDPFKSLANFTGGLGVGVTSDGALTVAVTHPSSLQEMQTLAPEAAEQGA